MTQLTFYVCTALAFLLSSVPVHAKLPKLIPRKILFGNPVKASASISPDGKYLSYLAPDDKDVLQVWVRTVGKKDDRKVTNDPKRGIRMKMWTYAPGVLLYLQDKAGDENFHLYAVDIDTSKVRELTPFKGVRAQPMATSKKYPDEILVGMNKRNPRVFDVYRVSLKTGEAKLDTKNPGNVVSWEVDPNHQVRVAQSPTPDGGMELKYREDTKSEWKTVVKWGMEDADGGVIDFTKDGKGLYLRTSEGRDTLAVVKRDLKTGKETLIASDPGADASSILYDAEDHNIQAVAFNRERVKWKILDKSIAEDIKFLEEKFQGEPVITSRTYDRKTWIVGESSDVKPGNVYLYDAQKNKLTHLYNSQPALKKYTLAPMKPVTIEARDGLKLVCYLTLPVGIEPKNLPLMLTVHGGPWARDDWGYSSQHQWLANRGYAVLSVNYRGSTGFGKKFLHAGDREWAGKMHTDLLDAVNWTVKKGYVDKKKVCIYGGSYGGYAALVGATFTPDFFTCAVDIVGPSNLVSLLKTIPPYWAPMKKLFSTRVGDLEKEEDFLKSRSPLFKVDKIKIPILICQGANDPRVKQAESEQIVKAMKEAGKEVKYMLFKDEGHGLARPENRMKFFAEAEKFLAKHLGGRLEPAPAGK